jgi:hypothetical protein
MDLNKPSKRKQAEATNAVPYDKAAAHRERERERAHVRNNILIQ